MLFENEQDFIQKKTFTKWINKHLKNHESNLIVKDLFVDIRDGLMLIYLLEVLSGNNLKKEKGPNMKKLHFLSNVKIALNFLTDRKIKLVNINPSDIVEGKPSIVLGLIWSIILYFQIEEYDKKSQNSGAASSATDNNRDKGVKLKLLTWIQKIIPREYNVTITDFGKCWRNGIAFNALIDVFSPNLIDMKIVMQSAPQENIERAFEMAEKHLGIAKLLDSEDVIAEKPDEKSIMTYVSQFLELKITKPVSPAKKIKLSNQEPGKSIEKEANEKIKRFILNVKESQLGKLKHVENAKFNEIFKIISNLTNELELIPNLERSTGDPILDKDFRTAINILSSCQWLLDESLNNDWKTLCKWLVSSEKLLDFHRNNKIGVSTEITTDLFEQMNVQLKEFENHFKNSPFHSPILAELQRCMINTDQTNKVFVSYTIFVEKRIQKVVKEEFGVRQKILFFNKIAKLKIVEKEIRIKLQYWKRELESLKDAEFRLSDFQTVLSKHLIQDIPDLLNEMEKLLSVDPSFKEWFGEFKFHWLDTERELTYIQTSLKTYIDEWNKMEKQFIEIEQWMNINNDLSISPNEYISQKQIICEFEKNIAFLSEQSSNSGKEILYRKLETIKLRFDKYQENKSMDIDNLRKEYKIKVENIKRWLEKSEALESFDIKFSKESIDEYSNIIEESMKSSENVKLDFQALSKIGQRISKKCSNEESERMLGELKIHKIRLLTLIDDRPKLIKKLKCLSEIFQKCEDLFSQIEQWITQTENQLTELLVNFQCDKNKSQEMFDKNIETCLHSITIKENFLRNIKQYITDIESLKLSNFPLKPIYSRENQNIEKLHTDEKSDFDLFHEAIRNGNINDFVKYYKDDYKEKEQYRRRPIHYASRHGQVEIVKLLLSKECDIEAKSSDNWRAIHYACRETHSEVAKLLIEHSCDIESVDGDNLRPIHHASRYGPYETAKLLIDKKCDIEATEKDQWRPIHYACRNNQESIVQLLVDNNCKIDEITSEKWSPIHYACRYGHLEIVKILIKKHAKIEALTSDGWRPIHFACRYGFIDIFNELLKCNADIEVCTSDGRRPIHFACEYGYFDIFKLLKNKGCNLESSTFVESMRPIHFACSGDPSSDKHIDRCRIAKILIYENSDIEACNKENWRPIHLVCRNGNFDIAKCLIERTCNVEAETFEKLCPIHVACTHNNADIVQLLIESDCSITKLNNMNQSLLDIAKQNQNEEIINILNEKISNPEFKNGHRLLLACKEGNKKMVESMLKRKCDINICDEHGMRPIHLACMKANNEIVQLLIRDNCQIDVLDKSSRLPINIAEELNNQELVNILKTENSNRELIEEMTSSMNIRCNYQCDHKLCSLSLHSNNFEKGDLIGEGGFGKVYLCKSSINNREFAIKYIPKTIVKSEEIKNQINTKLKDLKHIRIVNIFGATLKGEHLCIFMEYVPGGSLQKQVTPGKSIPTDRIKRYTEQLLEGLEYLHENKIIHRDIKPANILLNEDDNVKLADFDLSRILIRSDGRTTNAKTIFGTAYYMAPEVFHGEGYTFSSDIWSLGVTIYTMITGYPPYHEKSHEQAMYKIASTRKIEFPESWKFNELRSFMEIELLNSEPSKRQSAKNLLKSNIFILLSKE